MREVSKRNSTKKNETKYVKRKYSIWLEKQEGWVLINNKYILILYNSLVQCKKTFKL